MIKICSWNIQAGGGSRIVPVIKTVIKSQSGIVVFSEFRNNDAGASIRNQLTKAGYRHQAVTNASAQANSVLIASVLPFESQLYPSSDPEYGENIVGARFSAFLLVGVYLPHKKKHTLLPYLTDRIERSDMPCIIAGDFNTGINHVDQKGKSFWYTSELAALRSAGTVDAFRLVNGQVEEYSWYSHQGNGYRYDHTYVTEDLVPIITNCYYDHAPRVEKMSDHSPMYLELG